MSFILNVLSIVYGGWFQIKTEAPSVKRKQGVDKKFATCKIELTSHLIVT